MRRNIHASIAINNSVSPVLWECMLEVTLARNLTNVLFVPSVLYLEKISTRIWEFIQVKNRISVHCVVVDLVSWMLWRSIINFIRQISHSCVISVTDISIVRNILMNITENTPMNCHLNVPCVTRNFTALAVCGCISLFIAILNRTAVPTVGCSLKLDHIWKNILQYTLVEVVALPASTVHVSFEVTSRTRNTSLMNTMMAVGLSATYVQRSSRIKVSWIITCKCMLVWGIIFAVNVQNSSTHPLNWSDISLWCILVLDVMNVVSAVESFTSSVRLWNICQVVHHFRSL